MLAAGSHVEGTLSRYEPIAEIELFLLADTLRVVFEALVDGLPVEVAAHSADVQRGAALSTAVLPGQRQRQVRQRRSAAKAGD